MKKLFCALLCVISFNAWSMDRGFENNEKRNILDVVGNNNVGPKRVRIDNILSARRIQNLKHMDMNADEATAALSRAMSAEEVQILIGKGARINEKDLSGRTVVDSTSYLGVFKALIENGADLDSSFLYSKLFSMGRYGYQKIEYILTQDFNFNLENVYKIVIDSCNHVREIQDVKNSIFLFIYYGVPVEYEDLAEAWNFFMQARFNQLESQMHHDSSDNDFDYSYGDASDSDFDYLSDSEVVTLDEKIENLFFPLWFGASEDVKAEFKGNNNFNGLDLEFLTYNLDELEASGLFLRTQDQYNQFVLKKETKGNIIGYLTNRQRGTLGRK